MTKEKHFIVSSGKINITDPCYNKKTWCANFDLPAENGKWICGVEFSKDTSWGQRVSVLWAHHETFKSNIKYISEKLPNKVGVDSGQAGIFCSSIYPNGKETGKYGDLNTFYGRACKVTVNNPPHHGIVDGAGICSESGYGDGGYEGLCAKNKKGEIIAVRVMFIDDDYHEEEEEC